MKCLETRRRPDGLKVRRYRTDEGVTVRTIELPIEVFRTLVPASKLQVRLTQRMAELSRQTKKQRALTMIRSGVKPVAIANDLGLTVRTVERYRRSACPTS